MVQTGLVFNKSYHARARRGGMVSVAAVLEQMIERAADRRRRAKKQKDASGVQLELFPAQPVITGERPPADRPLDDLLGL